MFWLYRAITDGRQMLAEFRDRPLNRATPDVDAQIAFGDLVRRYQDAAFASAYAILKDRSSAEDATQAAFVAAWVRRNDLREPLAFGSWFRTIVRTECFRLIRKNRLATVPLEDADSVPAAPVPDEVSRTELRDVVKAAVGALSESERTVIVLRYLSDLSYEEMSEFLDLPLSTVKKRLHDARKRMLGWFTNATSGERARGVLREYRPSRDSKLETRVMKLATFLNDVIQGHAAAVASALVSAPELLDAKGEGKLLWSGTANALYVAAICGQPEIVRLLIGHGVRLEPETPADVSPLAGAAVEGRFDIVKILLDAGATVDVFAACALGDAVRVDALLTGNPPLARARLADGKTALHFCRSVEVATRLLAAGARADLDAVDDAGVTPLEWIGASGRYKGVCQYLIAEGAKAESSDIFKACSYGDIAAVVRLIDDDPSLVARVHPEGPGVPRAAIGSTPLHVAAVRGELEIAALLIQRGADLNARAGEQRVAPLHGAAAGGHAEVAKALIGAGADAQVRDGVFGATPEEWARFFGHQELAELLRNVTR